MSDVFMSVNGPVSRVNNKMMLSIDNFTAIKQKIKAASTHPAVFNSWMKRGGNTDLSWGQREKCLLLRCRKTSPLCPQVPLDFGSRKASAEV